MAMDLTALLAQVNERKAAIEARKVGGAKIGKFPTGVSRWRILPGWRPAETEYFAHEFGQHWVKDGANKVVGVLVCDWDTFGKPCDYCSVIKGAIRSTSDDAEITALKEYTSRKQILVNAVQISGAGFDPAKKDVPQLVGLPNGVYEKFINLLQTRMLDEINILDLAEGRDIIVDKSGAGLLTKYEVTDAAKNTAIDPSVMDKLVNIDAFIKGERDRGNAVGIGPLNKEIGRVLNMEVPTASTARTSSLVGATALAPPPAPKSAALAAPALEVPPVVVAPVVAAAAVAAVAPAAFNAPLGESDLDSLLAELS